MDESITALPADAADTLELGLVLGKSQAFGLIAGRCSAAQAESLSRLRKEQKYRRITPHWRDFCSHYLKMSQTQADQIINLWEEFGAGYFEVSQLTRVSAETYRALAPSIQDGALHANGEAIELSEENAQKVSAAVAELRRALPAAKKPGPKVQPLREIAMEERLADLDKRCTAIAAEFAEFATMERSGEEWLIFTAILSEIACALRSIELESGLR